MTNNLQWNSFDNAGSLYAMSLLNRLETLTFAATAIQRGYRCYKAQKPLDIGELVTKRRKQVSIKALQHWLAHERADSVFLRDYEVFGGLKGYEKIDGTNLGIAEDGSLYGRRMAVEGTSYQKASLAFVKSIDALGVKKSLAQIIASPPNATARKLPVKMFSGGSGSGSGNESNDGDEEEEEEEEKEEKEKEEKEEKEDEGTVSAAGGDPFPLTNFDNVDEFLANVEFRLYGELGVPGNNNKFDYASRPIAHQWFCFGVVLKPHNPADSPVLIQRLCERGFWLKTSGGKITCTLSDPVVELLARHSVPTPDLKCVGRNFLETITNGTDFLLTNNCEGVVIVGHQVLVKWKSAAEDESNSKTHLEKLDNFLQPPYMTDYDVQVHKVLVKVASNRPIPKPTAAKAPKAPKDGSGSGSGSGVSAEEFTKAFDSALTKYDDLSVFFSSNRMKEIGNLIGKEVISDLKPTTPEGEKDIQSRVMKAIGVRYGEWKKAGGK